MLTVFPVASYNVVGIYEWCVAMFSSPRDVPQELDLVTLHNMVLMNMEENPTQGFEKLQFLLQQVACPLVIGWGREGGGVP